jgi:hypothetical protein
MTVEEIFNSVRISCADRPMTDDCTVIGLEYLGQTLPVAKPDSSV